MAPGCKVEVLTPDFRGQEMPLAKVIAERPDVFNHNVETVPRLYPMARRGSDFLRSARVLRMAKEMGGDEVVTKSGLMVGLGEEFDEMVETFGILREHGVQVLTVGQYLRPTENHLPVDRYWHPDEFEALERGGARRSASSRSPPGPLVAAPYHADESAREALERRRAAAELSGAGAWRGRRAPHDRPAASRTCPTSTSTACSCSPPGRWSGRRSMEHRARRLLGAGSERAGRSCSAAPRPRPRASPTGSARRFPGFVVTRVIEPAVLALEGQHRFCALRPDLQPRADQGRPHAAARRDPGRVPRAQRAASTGRS